MPDSAQLPDLITEQQHLDSLCALIEEQQQIALDTEFVRTKTYKPSLGLLQAKVSGRSICIDPLADMDMQPLWQLLFDPQRSCILHSAKQDMEVMWFEQGAMVGSLLDTQICAGLLGFPAQIGYAGIVAELLNIEISKTQTRTDWSRRPLSAAQLHYAAEDVEHLPAVLKILQDRLEAEGRFEWALEDSAELLDVSLYQPEPNDAWQRIKSVPFLPVDQQARARALASWREQRAINSNIPRQWVAPDKTLLLLAEQNPQNLQELERIRDIPDNLARKQGSKLLGVLAAANESMARGDMQLEQLTADRDLDKKTMKKLNAIVKARATELNIAAEVLASKRDIQALMRGGVNPRVITGWRNGIIGEELVAALG